MRWCWELGHFEADLGDDDLGGALRDAGDFVEAFHGGGPAGLGIVVDGDRSG